MKRGEVYWANIVPRSGSEQQGTRPVVVMSHDSFNETPTWRSVIVVPLTTSESQARRGPTAVEIPAGAAGLKRRGVALCHQVTTLDRSKLTKRVGALSLLLMQDVRDGLLAAMDLA
ncbi:MAG: type II toxin-antitoxin system PemK/MazF family toxin [Deltaproteobacteria bacterium]|nr:type II toxin-antitoxin system PemK/MazF family toxin [Deltaproteobacteria bacterium]